LTVKPIFEKVDAENGVLVDVVKVDRTGPPFRVRMLDTDANKAVAIRFFPDEARAVKYAADISRLFPKTEG
jgi:hypothetical protein